MAITAFFSRKACALPTVAKASLLGSRATTNQPVLGTEAMADTSSRPLALMVMPTPRKPAIARSCRD